MQPCPVNFRAPTLLSLKGRSFTLRSVAVLTPRPIPWLVNTRLTTNWTSVWGIIYYNPILVSTLVTNQVPLPREPSLDRYTNVNRRFYCIFISYANGGIPVK